MSRFLRKVALAATLSLAPALATTYRPASPEALALAADLVFVGQVDSVSVTEADGLPWTSVVFTDLTVLRDRDAEAADQGTDVTEGDDASTVTIRLLGGALLAEPALTVGGLPTFTPGSRWLVLAYQDDGLASPIVGVAQGAWQLGSGGARGEDGTFLAVEPSGALVRAGAGASEAEILEALSALLERGAPTPAAESQEEEPAPAPAPEGPSDAAGSPDGEAPPDASDGDPLAGGSGPAEPPAQPAEGAPQPARGAAPAGGEAAPPQGVRYRVDDAGGPLLLSESVDAAARAWVDAAPDAAAFTQDESAKARIAYGAQELMGPDALSLTLLWADGRTDVLVSPLAGAYLRPALVHELGLLLGLPEGGQGVMARALPEGATAPTPAEVAELRDRSRYTPTDLDRNGEVDFYDLALFGRAYGQTGVNLSADFNGDGKVDSADLELLKGSYEFGPPAQEPPQ